VSEANDTGGSVHIPPSLAERGTRVRRRDAPGVFVVRGAFRNDRGAWFVDLGDGTNGIVAPGVPLAALMPATGPDVQTERDKTMDGTTTIVRASETGIDPVEAEKILHIVKTGDIGRMTDEQKLIYYKHECDRMGLDPMARPLEFISLQGKLTLYAKRIAGDMLAAKHNVTVQILEGPEVRDFGGTKVLFVKTRAALPAGRYVDDVGAKPLADVAVQIMKCVTVSHRRATLRLCGWGGPTEDEISDLPPEVNPRGDREPVTADVSEALGVLSSELASADTLELVIGAYNDNHDAIHEAGGNAALIRAADICKDWLEANVGKGLKTKFTKAINAAEDERRTKIKARVDPNADPLATTPAATEAPASQSEAAATSLGASLDTAPDFRTLCEVWNAVLDAHRAGKFGQPALDKLMDRFNARAQTVQAPAERVATLAGEYERAANAEDVERCDRAVKALKLDKASAERKQLAAANVAARTRLGLPVKAPRAPKAGEQPTLPGTSAPAASATAPAPSEAPATASAAAPTASAAAVEDDPERAAIEAEASEPAAATPPAQSTAATSEPDPFADDAPAATAAPVETPDFPTGAKIRPQEWADKQKGRAMQHVLNSFAFHYDDFEEKANTVKAGVAVLLQFQGVKDGDQARDMLKKARDERIAKLALAAVAGRPAE